MKYPFTDNDLRYDNIKHRYILTMEYVQNVLGVNLESQIGTNSGIPATTIINSLLDNVSSEVYNYIYQHNNTQTIQYIIAKCPSAREIIKEAMGKQALYMFYNGDLGFSTNKDEKEVSLNKYAKEIVDNQEVLETGVTLTYTGTYRFNVPIYSVGEY